LVKMNLASMDFSWFSGKKLYFVLHIAVWLTLFIIPTYLLYLDSGNDSGFLSRAYEQTALYVVIFYTNYLWLAPRFFFRHRKILFFVLSLLLVATAAIIAQKTIMSKFDVKNKHDIFRMPPANTQIPIMPPQHTMQMEMKRPRPSKNWPLYNFMITGMLISGFGLGLKFSDKLIQNEKERKESEKERLNSELAFLKNQINPHFFFNTLNNIYSLVQLNVNDGQKAILQLSRLMRYVLYETDLELKPLNQEIGFMEDYIELMKLRLSDKVALSVTFPTDFNEVSVPPLLFLPFIENAFKHGVSYRKLSFINILMNIDEEKIHFECSNSIGGKGEELLKPISGIGLENVKKRLLLLFPGKHSLEIHSTEESFNVNLNIFIQTNPTE
jgi:two-component system, LytTR family, sensor kinase